MAFGPKRTSGEFGENQRKSAELAHQTAHNSRPAIRLRRKGQKDTLSREKGRQRFLEFYAEARPEVLSDLWEVRSLFPTDANPCLMIGNAIEPVYPELWAALSDWARKHLLTFRGEPVDWATDTALETLRTWRDRLASAATVSQNLPEAERNLLAILQEAGEALDPETERWRRRQNSRRLFVCVDWSHTGEMHEAYPAGDPAFYSVTTGESAAELGCGLSIAPWNRPGGETEPEFRGRAWRAVEEYIRRMKEWTARPSKKEMWHFDALAYWNGGSSEREIRERLAAVGLNFGSENDLTAISHGLKSAAAFIEIDRRR